MINDSSYSAIEQRNKNGLCGRYNMKHLRKFKKAKGFLAENNLSFKFLNTYSHQI